MSYTPAMEGCPMTATNLPALIQGPDGVFRADSRDVAERFGKRHDNVLRAIDELVSGLRASGQPVEIIALNFEAFKINDLTGASTSHYLMDRDGFTLLAMGFTGTSALKWKLAYIQAFNAMEAQTSAPQMGKQLSLVEMLDAAAAEIRAEQSRRLAVESRLTIAQQALGQETIEHKITKQELQLFTGLENSIAIESLASKLGLYPGPFKKYLLDKYVYSGGWHSGERLLAVPKDELHVLDQILVMPGMMDPRGGGWSKAVYDYLVTPYGQKLMIKRLNSGRLNSLIKTDLRIVGTK
jgi:Rha family phage regulatory protein